MTKQFQNGLFIFRRDLRIIDNNGLNIANESCKNIYPIFIFIISGLSVSEVNNFNICTSSLKRTV